MHRGSLNGKASRSERIILFSLLALILTLSLVHFQVAAQTGSPPTTINWADSFQVVQHPLPSPGSDPWAITVDPRGLVWFVEQGTNRLGEYNPGTGNFTEFNIPTPHSEPISIASDSSGNIWFTELSTNKLGELSRLDSAIREYPIPGSIANLGGSSEPVSCGPTALLPDPTGAIWIACLFSNQIDSFRPNNDSFGVFDLPIFQSAPAGMALDGKGNLWFTAADAEMLGEATIAALRNGTTNGIREFAPINDSYIFRFTHATSFLGGTSTISSSLPTPSGIAIARDGMIWVTEHVDSSFDGYNVATGTLDRYWTSQTLGHLNQSVSFPNGIAVDNNGVVWIGEHYGNKIAEFNPANRQLVEYPVPCCQGTIAGVYSVALDQKGNLWFVEIVGDAIGELAPVSNPPGLSLTMEGTHFSTDSHGSLTIPLTFESSSGAPAQTLSLDVSGFSGNGSLVGNATVRMIPASLSVGPGQVANSTLSLSLRSVNPGSYYLTLTAASSPINVEYSVVVGLNVVGTAGFPILYVAAAAAALSVAAAFIALRAARVSSRRRTPRRVSGRSRGTRARG